MQTLGKYDSYELSDMKIAQPQHNMQVGTIQARRFDPIENEMDHRVILVVINNNTQFETLIPIDAWKEIISTTTEEKP